MAQTLCLTNETDIFKQRDSPADGSDSDHTARASDGDEEEEEEDVEVEDHFAPLNDVAPRRRSGKNKRNSLDDNEGAIIKVPPQEEVNALDLESLQLQDKEIPFDKLTKLEKIGSGGFKVSRSLFSSVRAETDQRSIECRMFIEVYIGRRRSRSPISEGT